MAVIKPIRRGRREGGEEEEVEEEKGRRAKSELEGRPAP